MTYGPYEQIAVKVQTASSPSPSTARRSSTPSPRTMMNEMIDVFTKVNTDDEVGAVIVTGAGRAFCAGADLSGGASTFDATTNPARKERDAGPVDSVDWSDERVRDGGGRVTLAIFECLKPVIAAVNGPAVGVGVTMQLADGYPHRQRGRALRLRLRAPRHRAGSGVELVPAAHRRHLPGAGVVLFRPRVRREGSAEAAASSARSSSRKQLLPRARAIAREIVDNTAPVSVALIRQMMWRGLGMDHPMEAHKVDIRGIYARGASADVREGVSSFLEKRPAKFPQKVSTACRAISRGGRSGSTPDGSCGFCECSLYDNRGNIAILVPLRDL